MKKVAQQWSNVFVRYARHTTRNAYFGLAGELQELYVIPAKLQTAFSTPRNIKLLSLTMIMRGGKLHEKSNCQYERHSVCFRKTI